MEKNIQVFYDSHDSEFDFEFNVTVHLWPFLLWGKHPVVMLMKLWTYLLRADTADLCSFNLKHLN